MNHWQRPQHLAVHLTLVSDASGRPNQDRIEAYVGWTGMASASSLAHFNVGQSSEGGFETIEMDPQYAQGLGLAQGNIVCMRLIFIQIHTRSCYTLKVEIGLLHDLPQASSVGTEPLTSDDWEIIVS